MADPQLQQIWQQALAEYKKDTGKDLNDKSLPHPLNVEELISILHRRHGDFDKATGTGKELPKYLKNAVGPFNLLQNMFGGMAGAAFPPSSQILGAVTVLVQAGQNVTSAFDAVSALFGQLSTCMGRFQVLLSEPVDEELKHILAKVMASMLRIMALATKRTHSKGEDDQRTVKHAHWERVKRSIQTKAGEYLRQLFTGGDDEIKTSVESLKSLIEEEDLMMTALTKRDATVLRRDTLVLKGEAASANTKLTAIEASVRENRAVDKELLALVRGLNPAKPPAKVTSSQKSSNEKSEYLRQRLSPLDDASVEMERIRRERVAGTLTDISTDVAVAQWLARKVPVLQLAAGVGTGKSFFASRIVDILLDSKQEGGGITRHSTGYFFWKQRSLSTNSITRLLQTIAYQVAQNDEAYKEHLNRELRKPNFEEESVQYWWKILFEVYFSRARARAFIVVEGLDDAEESEREDLLKCFRDLLATHNGQWPLQLQCLFCTDLDLAEKISATFQDQAVTTKWVNTGDLQIFIGKRLEHIWKDTLVDPDLYDATKAAVGEASHSSFLLASLLVDDVTALSRENDVRDRLLHLPKDLESATPLALSRLERQLDQGDIIDLTDILAWVICSHTNLSLRQLDALLYLRSHRGARVIDLEDRISNRFASLFVLSHGGSENGHSDEQTSARKRNADKEFRNESGESLPVDFEAANDNSNCQILDIFKRSQDTKARLSETYVRFEHGMIADHIRAEAAINIVAGTRMEQLRVRVLRGCLDVICGDPDDKSEDREAALGYCGLFVSDHVLDVELSKVDAQTKCLVAKRMVQLLRDDAAIDRWITTCGSWLQKDVLLNRTFVDRVCMWLKNEDAQKGFDDETLAWIASAAKSPVKVLFEKLASLQVSRWLSQRTSSGTIYFTFANTYLTMISTEGEVLPDPEQDMGLTGATVDRIYEVARWLKREETAYWHSRIGFALRNGDHWPDAINAYELAMEKDPTDGGPVSALALVHDTNGRYDDAVKFSKISIELFKKTLEAGSTKRASAESTPEEDLFSEYLDLGDYHVHQKDIASSVESYRKAYKPWTDPQRDTKSLVWNFGASAATACLTALYADKQYDEAMQMLETFNDHPRRFSEAFVQIYTGASEQYLLRLAYETKRLDVLDRFLLNASLSLAHYGTGPQAASLRYERAIALLRLDPKRQCDALRIFESISESDDVDPPGMGLWGLRVRNEKTLGAVLLDLILQAREDDRWAEVGQYADKLKDLIKPGGNEDSEFVLAVWERLNGRPHRARRYLLGQIGIGVDMLSDDDPMNDAYAWSYLGNVFLALGDAPRAVTCGLAYVHLQLLDFLEYKKKEVQETQDGANEPAAPAGVSADQLPAEAGESKAGSSQTADAAFVVGDSIDSNSAPTDQGATTGASPTTDSTPAVEGGSRSSISFSDLDEGLAFYSCDGPCFGALKTREPMYRCSYCITDFCKSCHDLIMSGENTGWNICSRLHRHFLYPGVTEQFPKGKLKVGNDFVKFDDWMDAMQEEYGLEPRKVMVPDTKAAAEEEDKGTAQEAAPSDAKSIESPEDTKEGALDDPDTERHEEHDGYNGEKAEGS